MICYHKACVLIALKKHYDSGYGAALTIAVGIELDSAVPGGLRRSASWWAPAKPSERNATPTAN